MFLPPATMQSSATKTKRPTKSSRVFLENLSDEFWMNFALAEARQAAAVAEVPIGAVIVLDNVIIGSGYNQPIRECDPSAHAEIIALREAAHRIGNYRLTNATMYATIEPCAMCAGALVNARIKRLVYGAAEPRQGAVNSIFQICTNSSLNHQIEITAGVEEAACKALMQSFFQARR
ncbi:MAG: tRNA adenosine(34) deaminase TadA [Blastocatellia bacterium]